MFDSPLTILIIILMIGVLLVPLSFMFWLRRIARQRLDEAVDAVAGQPIILSASFTNFFGQKSINAMQVRGNGTLLLTEQMLYFLLWVPRRELQIPLESITAVDVVRRFKGKSVGRMSLLRIDFINEMGEEDAAAWWLREHAAWHDQIETMISRQAASGF